MYVIGADDLDARGRSPGFILGHNPSDPKFRIASRGCGAVERAGRLHFSFDPLYSAGPDLEVPRYSQHALLGPQLNLYTLLHGGIDLGPPKLFTALHGSL
jgi:hypothetical protein